MIPVVQQSDTTNYIQHIATVDTIYRYDSIFIREVLKGDTLYLTRIEYRDRWHVQMIHDTILDTQIVEKVIEHPPERYIPPFYKQCTTALWVILAAGTVYIIGKCYMKWT